MNAASNFMNAMCMWHSAKRVSLLPSGFVVYEAESIFGATRRYVSGRWDR